MFAVCRSMIGSVVTWGEVIFDDNPEIDEECYKMRDAKTGEEVLWQRDYVDTYTTEEEARAIFAKNTKLQKT